VREQSPDDARVAYLRLTDEGERRLEQAFTGLRTEREQMRAALAHLTDAG
jgi:DNA-binding MarR family transcriptional regulator